MLEKALDNVAAKNGEKPELQGMFCSRFGKLFGRQVDEILEFTMRGLIISSFMPMMKAVEDMAKGIAGGELDGLIPPDTPPGELEKIKALKTVMADYDWDESITDIEVLFPKRDQLWYTAVLTFAIYTYLDRYTRSLLKHISKNTSLSAELGGHLLCISQDTSGGNKSPAIRVEDMVRFGVERRLREIEAGLDLGRVLDEIAGPKEASMYRENLNRFVQIRHKMAHHDPRPDVQKYKWGALEQGIKEMESLDLPLKDGLLRRAIDNLVQSMKELLPFFEKVTAMVMAAIIYPALIDGLVVARTRTH